MRLTAIAVTFISAALLGIDAHANTCKLTQRARLFSAADGADFTRKLAIDEVLTLQGSLESERVEVIVSTSGEKGFLDVAWAKQVCDFEAVTTLGVDESGDAQNHGEETSPDESTGSDGAANAEDTAKVDDSAKADDTAKAEDTAKADERVSEGETASEFSSDDDGDLDASATNQGGPSVEPLEVDRGDNQATKTPEEEGGPGESDSANAPEEDSETDADKSEPQAPKQLNKSLLPTITRSEPRIFEPLIGRDKVKRVVVLDTRIDEAITEPLDGGGMGALIAAELQNLANGMFEVVARADLMALVTRLEQAQLMGCADESCMTDIGALAEASHLVASSVTQAGEGRLLTVELLDAMDGRALRREAVTWTGDAKGLVELCAPQTARLVDAERGQSHSGAIQIVANEDGAEVYVDEQLAGETPIDIFANLDIGSHSITVKKDGYNLFEIPVVVGRGQTSLVQAELIRPWYREWWVWTAAGAVLTTAVLSFALSGDDITQQVDLPDTVIGVDTTVETGSGR